MSKHLWTFPCLDIVKDVNTGLDSYIKVFGQYNTSVDIGPEQTQAEVEASLPNWPAQFYIVSCWEIENLSAIASNAENTLTVTASMHVIGPTGERREIDFGPSGIMIESTDYSISLKFPMHEKVPYLGSGIYRFSIEFSAISEESIEHSMPLLLTANFA